MRTSLLPYAALLLAAPLAACSGRLADDRTPTGSASVVAASTFEALYTANTDQGTLTRMDRATGATVEVEVGAEPVRVARAGDLVFATLRAERAVAVLRDTGAGLEAVGRVAVGAEPYGVVAREDGRTVYVANQLGGTISVVDVETLAVEQEIAVPGQPRFLALHPSGRHLYVGLAMGGGLVDVDLGSGEATALPLPPATGADPLSFEPVALTGRVTGDLAVSPDGTTLAVPALYVNNVSPVGPVDPDDVETESDGYAGSDGTRRFNPAVVLVVTNQTGRLRTEYTETLSLQGFVGGDTVVSYPASATFAPGGEQVVLAAEGSDAVFFVAVPESIGQDRSRPGGATPPGVGMETVDVGFPGGSSLGFASLTTVLTGQAPRGVAFLDAETAFVHEGFDHAVAALPVAAAVAPLACCSDGPGLGGGRVGVGEDVPLDEGFEDSALRADEPIPVSLDVLPADLAEGRELFYSATDSRMALPGAGVSCATCHFDGRTDGLTWQFDIGPRQTPSLAGDVSARAPVTWTDAVPTVLAEVMLTSQGRMGGDGLSEARAEKVAAFVDSTPLPDVPERGALSDAALRGKALFESEAVGCAGCHNGATLADDASYDMFGETGVRTRTLLGIAASAPYLHDGSAPTLRAVLDAVRTGAMGDTGSLSEAEMDDLEAYLRTL